MHGRHIRKRGHRWHYFRHRPKRYIDVEPREIITFSLRTTCVSEAKLKAAQISMDLEKQWESTIVRGNSLASRSNIERYKGAVATNQALGFQYHRTPDLSDIELLKRLQYLLSADQSTLENKALLGMIEKPDLCMMQAFDRFWTHIEDEWVNLSPDLNLRHKR